MLRETNCDTVPLSEIREISEKTIRSKQMLSVLNDVFPH